MIRRPHGHADVPEPPVDFLLRSGLQLVLVGKPAVGCIEEHVEIALHRPAQTHAAIQQEHLRPQILQTVGRGRSGQPHHARELRQHLLQSQKPFGMAVFERGQLIDHQHVEGQLPPGIVLDQPLHVLPVDDVQLRLPGEGFDALLRRADHALHPQPL